MTSGPVPGTDAWHALVDEAAIDPDQRMVDAHHHLWPDGGPLGYGLSQLQADVGAGHRVERTVFMECRAGYRTDGPAEFAPVGETEFVAATARASGGLIAGIVGHADLRLANLDAVLDAHVEAGDGLFRGIRHALSRAESDDLMIRGGAPAGLFEDDAFRAGVARLGERGLTYDTWHYHTQNREFLALARAVPDTLMVLDHFGTPIGVGRYAAERDAIFEQWQRDVADIAGCENVVAKLGGMAMPDNGFGWHLAARPPTSDEFVAAQRRYYLHMIECFGVDRCMFESNFPVDRMSLSYRVLGNGVKKIMTELSPAERDTFFVETARRVYRLG